MLYDAMEENYMISTTISNPRNFHVEIFSTRETPGRTFLRGQNYAPVKDFQDPETKSTTIARCKMRDNVTEENYMI